MGGWVQGGVVCPYPPPHPPAAAVPIVERSPARPIPPVCGEILTWGPQTQGSFAKPTFVSVKLKPVKSGKSCRQRLSPADHGTPVALGQVWVIHRMATSRPPSAPQRTPLRADALELAHNVCVPQGPNGEQHKPRVREDKPKDRAQR